MEKQTGECHWHTICTVLLTNGLGGLGWTLAGLGWKIGGWGRHPCAWVREARIDDVWHVGLAHGDPIPCACVSATHVEGTVGTVWHAFPHRQLLVGLEMTWQPLRWVVWGTTCSLVCGTCWACGVLLGLTIAWHVACNYSDKLPIKGLFSSKALANVEGPSWQAVSLGGTVWLAWDLFKKDCMVADPRRDREWAWDRIRCEVLKVQIEIHEGLCMRVLQRVLL